jgi:hypothetical protein
MPRWWNKWTLCQTIFTAALCLTGSSAPAQQSHCPSLPATPLFPAPGTEGTVSPGGEGAAGAAAPSFTELAAGGAGVGGGAELAAPGGYLDNAIPKTMFRLRYDDGLNMNRPDRAEFFYAAWKELSFHPHGILKNGVFQGVFVDPNALGPVQSSGQLNYQEISAYLEYAVNDRLSAFIDVPYRIVHFGGLQEDAVDRDNPGTTFPEKSELGASNSPNGLSDMEFGVKYALLADPTYYLTLQLRAYAPTGDPRTGLSTGHWTVEPSLLYYQRMDRLVFQGQLSDWIPVGADAVAGNIFWYGLGLGYDVYQRGSLRVTPITEFVGWTVLSGYESFFVPNANFPAAPGLPVPVPDDHGVIHADGQTIVNAKIGIRTYFGSGSDIYIGYGRSLTGDRWYKDIYRVEYRITF